MSENDTNEGTHIEGPPPGTDGAGGSGDIPTELLAATHDTNHHGYPPVRHDKVHE